MLLVQNMLHPTSDLLYHYNHAYYVGGSCLHLERKYSSGNLLWCAKALFNTKFKNNTKLKPASSQFIKTVKTAGYQCITLE